MKVKNTYSRKKQGKTGVNRKPINFIFNINHTTFNNFTFNTINNFTQVTETKQDSSKSESSDLFDKLVKGPVFNVCNQTSASSAENSWRFFNKRQTTLTFYKSDVDLSVSTDISRLLFKDSKDSSKMYSLSQTPPEYCVKKLVKVPVKKTLLPKRKKPNCVQKKNPVIRGKKIVTRVNAGSCISSTPTRSNVLQSEGVFPDIHFSPIMPPQSPSKDNTSLEDIFQTEDKNAELKIEVEGTEKPTSIHGVTWLIEGLGNLGIKTPKKLPSEVNKADQEPDIFEYTSPIREKKDHTSEEPNKKYSQIYGNDIHCEKFSHIDQISIKCNDTCNKILSKKNSFKDRETEHPTSESPLENNEEYEKKISKKLLSSNSQEHSLLNDSQESSFMEKQTGNESVEKRGSRCSSLSLPEEEFVSNSKCEADKSMSENSGYHRKNSVSFSSSSPSEEEETQNNTQEKDCDDVIGVENLPEVNRLNESCEKKFPEPRLLISPFTKLRSRTEGERNTSKKYNKPKNIYLNSSNIDESSLKSVREHETQPLADLSNLRQDTSISGSTCETNKSFMSHNIEKRRPFMLSNKSLSHALELNGTFTKLSLEAGKKWRRSLLRQKQPEAKLERRMSMSQDILVKLIKETSILSNDTRFSCNDVSRCYNSLIEDQDLKDNSSRVHGGSPQSKVTYRRRRNYVFNMNEIPEENSANDTEVPEEVSRVLGEAESIVKCETADDTSVDRTGVYETPPILKTNPEALSAITDRKRSRRYYQRSLGECSIFSDPSDGTSDEESNLYASCCTRLLLDEDLEDDNINFMGKVGFMVRCGQEAPTEFDEAFPEWVLKKARKIGEGVFGEVFMLERPGEGYSVIKIIPVEGTQLVNGNPQKRFDEVLSELIITEELSMLRQNTYDCTLGFCELKNKFFLKGMYPPQLLHLWHEYDMKNRSDNECPDMFGPEQLYLTLELAHAGEPVETFKFKSPREALAVFLQTTFTLAVAESALDFEHRDLHIGNILVKRTMEQYVTYVLKENQFMCPTFGTEATIIDYTLSRISFKEDVLFFDLEKDPELFTAEGDYQFDIYRLMRKDLNHNWRDHQPRTNVWWLHYLVDKLTGSIRYKQKKTTKLYKEYMDIMVRLKGIILDFSSAVDLTQYLCESFDKTVKLIIE